MQRMESKPATYPTAHQLANPPKEPLPPISINKNEFTTTTSSNQPPGTPTTITPVGNKPGWRWKQFLSTQIAKPAPATNSATSTQHSVLDLGYITSRLMVMTTPEETSPDDSFPSTAELVRQSLDGQYPNLYMLYSLDPSSDRKPSYRKELFHNKVMELPLFDEKQLPPLVVLLYFCQKITAHLLESSSNIAVLHCHDGKNQLAFGACLLLAYHRVHSEVEQIIQFYTHHRGVQPSLTMSHKRYIQYLCDLSRGIIEQPQFNNAILKSISLSPIPLVNRSKNSCRPFVEIYDENQKKIFSSFQEISKLRVYKASDPVCLIPVNQTFNGNLTIHITHATINNSRRTHEGGVRICELTINSNFSTVQHSDLSYSRNELDGIDHTDKNPILFRLTLEITHEQKSSGNQQDSFNEQLEQTMKQPFALFRDENEFKQRINDAAKQPKQQNGDDSSTTVVPRPGKWKEDLVSSTGSTSSRNSHRSSAPLSPPPQSPHTGSFENPFQSKARNSQDHSPRTSQIPCSPSLDEKPNPDKTSDFNLVDIGGDIPRTPSIFERSMSSDAQTSDLLSSLELSFEPLYEEEVQNGKANSKRPVHPTISLPTPLSATIVSQSNEKPSPPTRSTSITPDYHVTIPSKPTLQPQRSQTLPKAKPREDLFTNLLDFKPTPPPVQPTSTSIGTIQKQALAETLDPTTRKIREWTDGKERNIRALLCSLSQITWPECTWGGCQMNDLLTTEQVKKVYRKAVLHIHPDKLTNDPNQPLAKRIFMELNAAWAHFEEESRQR